MQTPEPDIAVYLGPTGHGLNIGLFQECSNRLLRLPPIARGDLAQLPDGITTVLVVDGYFGTQPSVGHLELLRTLEDRAVYGCSSLGAIRAYELRDHGMVGIGRVYREFFNSEDFMDDEMALLHAPSPRYWPFSVPLVNVRFALAELEVEGRCSASCARAIVDHLKKKFFGDRTLEAVCEIATFEGGQDLQDALRVKLSGPGVKTQDLADALQQVVAATVRRA